MIANPRDDDERSDAGRPQKNVETYPLSAPILERWAETNHEPTEKDKAAYWRMLAKDLVATFKPEKQQMLLALAAGFWGKAKAERAEEKIADLERRLIALERRLESERKGFFYRGTWQDGESYTEGDFVTDHGGLWHCNAATFTRPGSCDAWQLAVKSGDRRR